MTLLYPMLALVVACLVWRREPRHGSVVAIHLVQLAFGAASAAGANPIARLLLLAGISATTAALYARLWAPHEDEWLLAGWLVYARFVAECEPTREGWSLAIELPLLAACALGLRSLALTTRARWQRATITDVVATLMLASDLVGVVWLGSWPGYLHWQGRAQAVCLAAIQLWWLWRMR